MNYNYELRVRCFLCSMPRFSYELECFMSNHICRACINYEGDRLKQTFDRVKHMKEETERYHFQRFANINFNQNQTRNPNAYPVSVIQPTHNETQVHRRRRPNRSNRQEIVELSCTPDLIIADNPVNPNPNANYSNIPSAFTIPRTVTNDSNVTLTDETLTHNTKN